MPYFENPETGQIEFRVTDVVGIKTLKDGSTRFKLMGGPYHNMVMRVYPPYDTIVYPDGLTYELHPPFNLNKSDKWVYVYNMELTTKNELRATDGQPFDCV
jgi:hypothetical protein